MTNPKWIIGFMFMFIACTVFSSIVEGTSIATGMTRMDILMNPVGVTPWTYIGNVWGIFWFRYAFLDEMPWMLARYCIFWPISVGLVVSLVASVFLAIMGFFKG